VERRVCFAAAQCDLPAGERGRRPERRRLVDVGDRAEPFRVSRGLVDLARRDGDLDRGREEAGLGREVERLVTGRSPDRRERALGVSLREAEEGEPGLGCPPELVGFPEGLLGLRELAEPEPDLAELVEGGARDARVPDAQLLACPVGELLRLGQAALELHHLGMVDPAHARESVHPARLAKVAGALRPLAGALEVGHVAAGADRVAVDDERRERVELAGQRGRARLVEEELPLGDLALLDEDVPLPLERADLEVAVAEAPSQLLGLLGEGERLREVVLAELDEALLQRPVPVLRSFVLEVEQPLRAAHPAVCDRHLEVVLQAVRDQGRDVGGPQCVALLEVAAVGPLEVRMDHFHLAVPHRRLTEQHEILGGELHGFVRRA